MTSCYVQSFTALCHVFILIGDSARFFLHGDDCPDSDSCQLIMDDIQSIVTFDLLSSD